MKKLFAVAILAVPTSLAPLASTTAAAQQNTGDDVIYLDQAWSQADREMYYQTSQGSRLIAYEIFLNLEVADSQELFRSAANSERYGLIPQSPNPRTNPDGLPVGLTKTIFTEGRWKGETVGVTCALCHTGELTYKGKHIRIDGGVGSRFDIMAYAYALDNAVQATLTDAAKFDRLATRLGVPNSAAKSELRERFASDAAQLHLYVSRTMVTPVPWGPGRIDAGTLIVNRVVSVLPDIPQNWSTPVAPTKPPFLWNSSRGLWTQWSGVTQDPIFRNIGETLGVFMSIDLTSKTPEQGLFDSSSQVLHLKKIEDALWRLAPPKWPEDVLGPIDRKKALEGKALFVTHCAGCHNAWPYTWTEPNKYGKRFIQVGLVPQDYVGTESQLKFIRPFVITAQLSNQLPPPYQGEKVVPTAVFNKVLGEAVRKKALEQVKLSEAETIELHGFRELPTPPSPVGVYKAAPRDGVWATAPFLHNGSVPNLYEMLIPAKERTKKFYVGRDFDPVKVGIDTSGNSGKFLLDTSLLGNSNAGHSFEDSPRGNGVIGPLLTDEQRWALVEYLKSIPEDAGRITPFGGPPQ
jgi:hypothetical protein